MKEKYEMNWVGKKKCQEEYLKPAECKLIFDKESSEDWDTTENMYIEGDNLEVLKIMQEEYINKIKCIYIDPPYNTGKKFIYNDKFGNKKDKHSDWLSMMYPRLKLARNLLTDDGVIFISIDDNEVHNLRKICDEIFGENNFVCNFIRTTRKGGGSMSKYVSSDHDYCLTYAKNIEKIDRIYVPYDNNYIKRYKEKDEKGYYFWDTFARNRQGSSNNYKIIAPDGSILENAWIYKKEKFEKLLNDGEIRIKKVFNGWSVQCKQRINKSGQIMRSQLNDFTNELGTKEIQKLIGKEIFNYVKPIKLVSYLIKSICSSNDIILDFFSGSATTAHAAMQLNAEDGGNRKYIMVQLPEETNEKSEAFKAGYKNICEIGKERIRRVGKKIKEEIGADIDYGFRVYKLKEKRK